MNIRTKEIYSEVYSVLNILGKEYISKLPTEVYLKIEKEKSDDYNPKYNSIINLEKQNIKKESLSMIALFHLKYWCDSSEEKETLNQIFKNNEEIYQQKIREKYNPDNLFKDKHKKIIVETRNKGIMRNNNTTLIEYKESFFTRFKNFIFKILHINR